MRFRCGLVIASLVPNAAPSRVIVLVGAPRLLSLAKERLPPWTMIPPVIVLSGPFPIANRASHIPPGPTFTNGAVPLTSPSISMPEPALAESIVAVWFRMSGWLARSWSTWLGLFACRVPPSKLIGPAPNCSSRLKLSTPPRRLVPPLYVLADIKVIWPGLVLVSPLLPATGVLIFAPALAATFTAPLASVSGPFPTSVAFPSSKLKPPAVCGLFNRTVKFPVALVPAEKTAVVVASPL